MANSLKEAIKNKLVDWLKQKRIRAELYKWKQMTI
jgi:hypothetical protein